MALQKEVKVGVIGLIVLFSTLFTFNYLNRKNVFSTNLIITAKFKDIEFLKKGDAVLIKGRQYGRVTAIYKEGDNLFVDMDVDPSAQVPATAKAVISELSMLGGRAISLVYEGACTSTCLTSGAVISGEVSNMEKQVNEIAGPMLEKFGKIADTLMGPNGINNMLANAHASAAKLARATKYYEGKMKGMSRTLPTTIKNFKELTDDLLSADQEQLANMAMSATDGETSLALDSLLTTFASMSDEDIKAMTKMLYEAPKQLEKVPSMVEKGTSAMEKANDGLDGLNKKLAGLQEGAAGTIPKLLYNGAYKDSLSTKIQAMADSIRNIREHPEFYLRLNKKK